MRKAIKSSVISNFERIGDNLIIQFTSGDVREYRNVPITVDKELESSESTGRYFNKFIKGVYESKKVNRIDFVVSVLLDADDDIDEVIFGVSEVMSSASKHISIQGNPSRVKINGTSGSSTFLMEAKFD